MSSLQESSLLKNKYFWIIVIAFVLEIVFFFVSPYLFESLEGVLVRLFMTLTSYIVLLLLIAMYFLFMRDEVQKKLQESREHKQRLKEYSTVINRKLTDLKNRFAEAMRIINNSSIYKSSQRAGYELPWYLVVGKEQEGKTSFVESSGLDFPLNINYEKSSEAEDVEQSFQWYFAEDAIFIDVPGHYVEQKDKEGAAIWEALLNLFAKKRWKRPINGIILTVSVESIMTLSEDELELYAKNLRDRFDEMSKAFMSNMPIYLFITKSDLIPGFGEYFSTLSERDKDQILGVTFDDKSENIDQEVIQPEIVDLLKRLKSSIMDKIQQEWDSEARSKILLFPDEFASVLEKLNGFIERTFSQTRYRQPLMLRGIYFTTVLQGNNLPEQMHNMSEQSRSKKGMFIRNVLTNVVFPEADIIKMDTNYRKTQRVKQSVAFGVAVALVAFATIYWVQDYNARLDRIELLEKTTLEYEHLRDNITSGSDFESVLSTLNKIQELQEGQEENISGNFWQIAYYKPVERNIKIDNLYEETLKHLLLPRIEKFIAEQIRVNINDYDLTWESTKAYSMLNNVERREKGFLQAWMAAGWSNLYPNKLNIQNDLNSHWEKLLSLGFDAYPLEEDVLTMARTKLLGLGHEALVYKQLKDSALKQNLPDFRFSQTLGSDAASFRGSDFLIPGFYTKLGYETMIVGQGRQLIKDFVSNNWVVGYSTELSEADFNEMYVKVQNYYFIDYKDYWSKALSSLQIPNYKSISEINYQLTSLTSGSSPIIGVLKALKENTMLYTPAEKLQMQAAKSKGPIGDTAATIASKNTITEVTDNTSVNNIRNFFSIYTLLLDDENKPQSKLKTAMAKLNEVYQEMTAIYGSVTPERDAFDIVTKRIAGKHGPIVMQGVSLPLPIRKWFDRALANDWEYLISRTKKHINDRYKKEVMEYYLERIEGRYPLVKKSKKYDIRNDDFEEFFKSDGILDSFYKSYISPFVMLNTKRHNYQFRRIDGSSMHLKKSFMNQLLVAHDIRKALFTSKEDALGVLFYIQPEMLGRRLATMEFHYDDNYIVYEHGLIRSHKLNWPAEGRNDMAKFSMYDLENNKVVELSSDGEWGFFKLIDQFNISKHKQRHGTDSVDIKYQKQRYEASYTVTGRGAKVFTNENPLTRFKLIGEI